MRSLGLLNGVLCRSKISSETTVDTALVTNKKTSKIGSQVIYILITRYQFKTFQSVGLMPDFSRFEMNHPQCYLKLEFVTLILLIYKKNFKQGDGLPCGLQWEDVDVVFALHTRAEFFDYLFRRSTGNEILLKQLKIVTIGEIYEGLILAKIRAEQNERNLKVYSVDDMQAKPQDCKRVDTHYSMPGIPDYAIDVWMSIMATGGLQEVPHPMCANDKSINNNECQLAQFGNVKFFGR